MVDSLAAEVCMVVVSVLLYASYHFWLFYIKGKGIRRANVSQHKYGLFNQGKIARVHFTSSICFEDDTICGIQQNRNALLAVSFLAGIASLLAQKILGILLDEEQQDQVRKYARQDPIRTRADSDDLAIDSIVVLAVNFLLLMACILAFGQSVRHYIHLGYFYKAAAVQGQRYATVEDAVEVTIQAQLAFTAGLRLLFFFPVTALWVIGPTAMLTSAVLTTGAVACLDYYSVHEANYIAILRKLEAPPSDRDAVA